MKESELNFIKTAIDTVSNGICDKMTYGKILVYKCGTIIRVDIKL